MARDASTPETPAAVTGAPVDAGAIANDLAIDAVPATTAPVDGVQPEAGAAVVTPGPTVGGVLGQIQGGHYLVAIAGLVWLLVGGLRVAFEDPDAKWAGWKKKLLAFGLALAGSASLALWDGAAPGVDVMFAGLAAGWAAAGMNDHARDAAGSR
jgi:hypothetical protein